MVKKEKNPAQTKKQAAHPDEAIKKSKYPALPKLGGLD